MIRYTRLTIFFALLTMLISCGSAGTIRQDIPLNPVNAEELARLITRLPAENEAENRQIFEELAGTGPAGIRIVAGMLVPAGVGDDTYARYALSGLAKYVTRPGAEDQRDMFETAVLEELNAGPYAQVRVFLMEQLQLAGSNRSIPLLQSYLGDDMLTDPAVQTLSVIGTQEAKQALHQALADTAGRQIPIIKALGDLQFTPAAADILPFTRSNDASTRAVALYALANMGHPMATDVLSEAADTTTSYQYTDAPSLRLLFARRLAEEGYLRAGSDIAREVLAGEGASHLKAAALSQLVANEGDAAFPQVLDAALGPDPELRAAALLHARQMPGAADTGLWIDRLNQSPPAVQADILTMLADRDEASLFPELEPFLQYSDLNVRLAAINAVAALGGADALPALMDRLLETTDAQEIEALKTALLQQPSDELLPAAMKALPEASGPAQAALIELAGARRVTDYFSEVAGYATHRDETVRRAALEALEHLAAPEHLPELFELLADADAQPDAERSLIRQAIAAVAGKSVRPQQQIATILQALGQAPGPVQVDLLHTLPLIGGKQALEAAERATGSSRPAIIMAATEALADWPDAAAIPALLNIIRTGPPSQSTIALNGYVRLVHNSKYSSHDKVQWLSDAAEVARTPLQKAIAIEGLASVQTPQSLKTAARYFDHSDEAVREQAIRTAAALLAPHYQRSQDSLDSSSGVLSVLEVTASPELARQIERQIRRIQTSEREAGRFVSLFNGRNLDGWTGATHAYYVENGLLINRPGGSGNLFTEAEYSDFILRFEFRLTEGANSGLGIRAPLKGDAAYEGMELQILDNTAEKYAGLKPWQYHGSVYGIAAARRGHLNPVGEWNTQEVIARGSHITVKLNGQVILDIDVKEAATPQPADGREHPGLSRSSGHIGFLGHGSEVAFRNIRIQDLSRYFPDYSGNSEDSGNGLNQPPEGFKALFNGQDLQGWKGLVENPAERARMSPDERARKQQVADALMHAHWTVHDGTLHFDGEGSHLCTVEEYGDFEMLLDWKIEPGGDSGVYLRGTPQVQIWDVTEWPQGSGGLYNNQQHPADPLTTADNPIGEWNHMRIKMIGERVTVHLNGQLVTDNVVMENYWDRSLPIYPAGQIELQSHSTPLQFRNIFIREIPRTRDLLSGEGLDGWQQVGAGDGDWKLQDGILSVDGGGGGWLSTAETYDDFKLELEYRLAEGGNSGVFLRAPRQGDPAYTGMEIQLLDDKAPQYTDLAPWQYTGSIYGVQAPSASATKSAGEWQQMVLTAHGPHIEVTLNGQQIIDTNLADHMDKVQEHPGLKRRRGYIGLQNHNTPVEFRNIKLTEIE